MLFKPDHLSRLWEAESRNIHAYPNPRIRLSVRVRVRVRHEKTPTANTLSNG